MAGWCSWQHTSIVFWSLWFDSRPRTHDFIGKESCWTTEAVTIAGLTTSAGEGIVAAVGVVWNLMTANVLLTLFVGASIISLGFRFYKKAKGAAK